MQKIILNNELTLSFEPLGKRVRLVVSTTANELVCRKETIKNLTSFLKLEENHLFKGRLQLNKHGDIIELNIQNKPTALISSKDFEQILNNLQ
ncbi:hypothetical protein [Pedobacter sp. Hv1]|uniref:hypothetical protein n=1 Tax=Pedobacter sp. Hv1 TaxID=1740090 RepID=UPI0006D8D60E|nr:hypothetical protein [Pedobacter sp. Hv1]KQC01080.1 hypothetical protein AQF98_10470 [Pedobacter sp. Hv1]